MTLDEVDAPFSVGVLKVEAADLTSDTARAPASFRDLLAAKRGIALAGEMASFKQPTLIGGGVVEVKVWYLGGCPGVGERAQRGCDGGHPVGVREELLQHHCIVPVAVCRHAGIVRVLGGNVDGLARNAVWIPERRAPQLRWVDRELPQEVGQFDYGRVSVVERAPVVLSDKIASEHDFVPGPRWVGLGHDETQPSEECGNGGVAAGEILGSEWLAMPDPVGHPNDGFGVVEATAVIEEVAAGFAVVVLGEKFGPSEPVELLDGGEYVGGGDVWLGHERSIDRLAQGVENLLLARPFGIRTDDRLTPRSTQPRSPTFGMRRDPALCALVVPGCRLRCRHCCRQGPTVDRG
jgi:hypothetical protein